MNRTRKSTTSPESEAAHFVGRSAELKLVDELLYDAARGTGATLLLEGGAGVGKSAFVRRCVQAAGRSSLTVSVACSRSAPQSNGIAAHIAARLGASEAGNSEKTMLDVAYDAVVAAARRRPILVAVDDFHFAKPNDVDTIEALVESAASCRIALLVAFSQAGAVVPALYARMAGWATRGALLHQLPPLTEAETGLLMRNLARSASLLLTPQQAAEVHRLSAGNPRYVRELLTELSTSSQREHLTPPSANHSAMALRASLPSEQSNLLAVAALIGRQFSGDWLGRICGAGDAAVGDFIQNAVDRGVVAELSAGSGFYAFCDAAVQRALADTIVTFRRRGICERIAQELIAAREDGGFDDVIAENWDAAGRHLEAAEWLSRVAEGRASQLQYRAAAALYERAASHLGDLPERQLETQELAAVHYELAGAWAEAVPLRERVMTTMNRNTSDDRYLDALRSLIVDYWYTDRERGLELLASLRRAREPKARNAAVRQMIALAIYLFTSGFSKEACETVHAIDPDDVDAACQPRYQLAVAMARRSIVPPDETLRAAANAAKLSETFPGEPDAWWLWMEATNLACCLGKIEAAVECAAQAAASSARSGNAPQSAPWTALLLAEVYSIAGDVARTHDLVCSLAGISDAGELWEANAAAIYVFAGLHAGDAALVDGFFNVRYLEKALADRQPALCGMYLRSYPEIMIARGHAALLADVLNRCVDSRFVDPLFFISLAVARFGPIECAERARAEICAREGGADGAVAAAAKQLFDAYAFTRRSQKVRAKEAAAAAAVAYGRLGYSLHRAFALELRGDLEEARTLYASLGAAREATRLASPRRKESRAYFGAALTQREREVARLVCAGETNPEIARRFHLSVRTVQHHMEAIYSKLGIRARWQLADALSGQLRRKSG